MKKIVLLFLLFIAIGVLSSCSSRRHHRCTEPYSKVVHEGYRSV